MAATFLPPVTLVCTTSLVDLGVVVPTAKVRRYDVRAVNIGSGDVYVDLWAIDPAAGANSHPRAKNFLIPFQTSNSAIDLETGFMLPAGWKMQAKASAASACQVTASLVEDTN